MIKRAAHLFTERNHKFVEGIYARLDQARCDYVEKEEKSIKFGSGEQWEDLDADEVDLRKKTEPLASPSVKSTSWEQWGGIVERGAPETLVLTRLKPCRTKARAPGPGPMRKRDWAPTASKYLKGCNVVLHTDGARAYKLKLDGVIHDNVCHSKKRIGHGGRSGGTTQRSSRRSRTPSRMARSCASKRAPRSSTGSGATSVRIWRATPQGSALRL